MQEQKGSSQSYTGYPAIHRPGHLLFHPNQNSHSYRILIIRGIFFNEKWAFRNRNTHFLYL